MTPHQDRHAGVDGFSGEVPQDGASSEARLQQLLPAL